MNKEKLKDSCEVLEKLIVETAKLYNSDEATPNQKALLETIIGAGIWYLPSSNELYSGKISKNAIEKIKDGFTISKLTQEHRFPRKQAGKILLEKHYKRLITNEISLYKLYISEFGKFNLVVKSENRDLIKFQKDDTFVDDTTSYKNAQIELVDMTIEEIKALYPDKSKNKKTKENKTNTELDEIFPPDKDVLIENLADYPELFENHQEKVQQDAVELPEPPADSNNNDKNYKFTGIELNGVELIRHGNATKCYVVFMNNIIDQFADAISDSGLLKSLIKIEKTVESLGTDVVNYPKLIIERGNYFYNSHGNSSTKKNRIIAIANELQFAVHFIYD